MQINRIIKVVNDNILNILFPAKCISCKCTIETDLGLCSMCFKKLEFYSDPCCPRCAEFYEFPFEGNCNNCEDFCLTKSFTLGHYGPFMRELVHKFKYEDKTRIGKFFAFLLANRFKKFIEKNDLLIPIPMYKSKLRSRKYSHTVILAKHIIAECNINYDFFLLRKTINNASQFSLNYKERKSNVKDCFSINPDKIYLIKNKKVLLLDDVITTGATINEAARILLQYGAKEVNSCVIARNATNYKCFNYS